MFYQSVISVRGYKLYFENCNFFSCAERILTDSVILYTFTTISQQHQVILTKTLKYKHLALISRPKAFVYDDFLESSG